MIKIDLLTFWHTGTAEVSLVTLIMTELHSRVPLLVRRMNFHWLCLLGHLSGTESLVLLLVNTWAFPAKAYWCETAREKVTRWLICDWRHLFMSSGCMTSPGEGTRPLAPPEQVVSIGYQRQTKRSWHTFQSLCFPYLCSQGPLSPALYPLNMTN